MQDIQTNGNAQGMVKLPALLDLAAAEQLLVTLRQTLETGGPARLDAGEVEALTSPCAQIILAAIRGNKEVTIDNPSIAFVNAFTDLGLGTDISERMNFS